MKFVHASRRGAALVAALIALAAGGHGAQAQGLLSAQYSIIMTGVTIGHVAWRVDIGGAQYTTAASGKASGVLSMLVNGEGAVAGEGKVENWHLKPVEFRSDITDEDGTTDLRIGFVDGLASVTATPPLKPTPERLPVTEADRHDVADPLSAVLITARPGESFFSADNCDHLLAIFDGRRRYNLALSFARIDKISLERSYSGPVLVCSLVLQPIAGYRPDSLLVKYVAGRREMELWLAPIAGTALMAPIRVAMPTLIGTLKIQADRFDTAAADRPPGASR
jgi:Protein of unknown function (DUF3108)